MKHSNIPSAYNMFCTLPASQGFIPLPVAFYSAPVRNHKKRVTVRQNRKCSSSYKLRAAHTKPQA